MFKSASALAARRVFFSFFEEENGGLA